jgi:hypothetical protein
MARNASRKARAMSGPGIYTAPDVSMKPAQACKIQWMCNREAPQRKRVSL